MAHLAHQVVRLALNFNLVSADLLARSLPLDFGPGLVFLEINYENLRRQKSPHEPRRPVSAYRLARELHLPYETCRRYANLLVEVGWCSRVDRGFVVTPGGLGDAAVSAAVPKIWAATAEYVLHLQRAGFDLPTGGFNTPFNVKPRVALEASLHFLNLLREGCRVFRIEATDVLLMYAVLTANTAHVTARLEELGLEAAPTPIPDEERRPVSAYRLAQDLRAPYETVRRHVRRLVDQGLLVDAADGGVYAPARNHLRPEIRDGVVMIVAEVRRFVGALSTITPLPLVEPATAAADADSARRTAQG